MQQTIKALLDEALKDLNIEENIDFSIEKPMEMSFGDFSSNVSIVAARVLKKSPLEVAGEIVDILNKKKSGDFEKIEVAGAGFINFFLSKSFVENKIAEAIKKDSDFGKNDSLKGEKALVEFTDPNPFKQFHIGHVMSNTIGETISRIHEANGMNVTRLCYQGDVGLHVAKAVWGMIQHKSAFPQDNDSLNDKAKFMGDAYVFGSAQYEEDENAKKEIVEINKKLFAKSDPELQIYYDKGRQWSLDYFENIYEKLGTKFNEYLFESETAGIGKETVLAFVEKGVFEKSEGAIIYDGEKEGLHTRVFINSEGLPTYEAKDLGLAILKDQKFDYDTSIVVTGGEQKQYFRVILSALEKIDPEISSKTTNIPHGLMQLSEGKMSSRKGDVVVAEEMLDKVKELVMEKMSDRDLTGEEKEEISKTVSVAGVKYSILKQAIGKNIIFDFEKSLSFDGDSGPYLQYAYTRAKSIIEKSKKKEVRSSGDEWQTTDLERLIIQYEDVIKNSLEELAPQYIVTYLTKLASEFNSFYANNKILDEDDSESAYKVAITKAVMIILRNGLDVLGIKVPEKM